MAQITIQKKKDKLTPEQILSNAGFLVPATPYPLPNMEQWRRFDPSKITSFIEKAGGKFSVGQTGNNESIKLSELKSKDELLFKKVTEKSGKLLNDGQTQSIFFEQLAEDNVSDNTECFLTPRNTKGEKLAVELKQTENTVSISRTIFYIEEGGEREITITQPSTGFGIHVTYIIQEPDSSVNLEYLTPPGGENQSGSLHIVKILQDKGSKSNNSIYAVGHRQSEKIFFNSILEQNAEARLKGINISENSHIDSDISIYHRGSDSYSNILFKQALLPHAHGVFWGNSEVIEGTKGCQAYQQNRNLILDSTARADAIPRLEIYTEDVAAAHGSATGELSDEEIFYLTTRGINESEAKKLLIRGFIEEVLGSAPDEEKGDETADTLQGKIWDLISTLPGLNL